MSNLQLRLISASVLIPVVFGALMLGGLWFTAFILVIYLVSLWEWLRLSKQTANKLKFSIFGLFYISIGFFEFYYLRFMPNGLYLVLTMLLCVWAADTGAYFVGRKIGKHKMAPSISPNKSWEGMAGSIVFSALTLLIMMSFAADLIDLIPNLLQRPTMMKSFILLAAGGALGYIGQMGDLIESFLKRKSGAKDSSNLIPGHGGVLDRVDSILLVAPFFVMLAIYVL